METNLVFFRVVNQKHLSSLAMGDDLQTIVPEHSVLHPSLADIVNLQLEGKKMRVARVVCSPNQVIAGSDGIYQAKKEISAPEGYIPLEEALIRYSGINLDA